MTTPTHGADVDALRATAQALCDTAEDLVATDLRVAGALSTLTWNGPDAMRARQDWDTRYGPALLSTARSLSEAGEHLLAEADQQEQASAADGAALPQVGPVPYTPPSIRATLAAELRMLRRFIGDITPGPETIGKLRGAIVKAGMALNINTLMDALPDPVRSLTVPGIVATPITAAGAVNDMASVGEAWRDGDTDKALRSGGSLLGTAVSRRAPLHGAAISVGWEGTYQFRDRVFSGSRWEENFVERNDAIADMIGPGAIPVGPATVIVAGAETGWEKLTEIYRGEDEPPGEGATGD